MRQPGPFRPTKPNVDLSLTQESLQKGLGTGQGRQMSAHGGEAGTESDSTLGVFQVCPWSGGGCTWGLG
jgi:hypothetical protein